MIVDEANEERRIVGPLAIGNCDKEKQLGCKNCDLIWREIFKGNKEKSKDYRRKLTLLRASSRYLSI